MLSLYVPTNVLSYIANHEDLSPKRIKFLLPWTRFAVILSLLRVDTLPSLNLELNYHRVDAPVQLCLHVCQKYIHFCVMQWLLPFHACSFQVWRCINISHGIRLATFRVSCSPSTSCWASFSPRWLWWPSSLKILLPLGDIKRKCKWVCTSNNKYM